MGARTIGTPAMLAMMLGMAGGCADREGIIEVHWQVDDRALERIYPLGAEPDTCEFDSQTVRYDLRVRLTVLENTEACASDPTNVDCQVIEPQLFPCNRSRGTALMVPASAVGDEDPGYLMVVEPMIDPTDAEPFVAAPSCIAAPGPRVRQVRPGRITDLEVYEFIVLAVDTQDGLLLDIEACRAP